MKVITRGKVRVNEEAKPYDFKFCKTVCIDLHTKRADIMGEGSDNDIPVIFLEPNEDSIHLDEKTNEELTEITFPEFKGWSILLADVQKYTLFITFVKYEF